MLASDTRMECSTFSPPLAPARSADGRCHLRAVSLRLTGSLADCTDMNVGTATRSVSKDGTHSITRSACEKVRSTTNARSIFFANRLGLLNSKAGSASDVLNYERSYSRRTEINVNAVASANRSFSRSTMSTMTEKSIANAVGIVSVPICTDGLYATTTRPHCSSCAITAISASIGTRAPARILPRKVQRPSPRGVQWKRLPLEARCAHTGHTGHVGGDMVCSV